MRTRILSRILREEVPDPANKLRGVIHCFTGDTEQARVFVNEFGLKLGIGGVLTFKTAEALRDAVRDVGIAPIILETDCPYLAPVPSPRATQRTRVILEAAKKLAELLEIRWNRSRDDR